MYVDGDPVNLTDPSGNGPIEECANANPLLGNVPIFFGLAPDSRGLCIVEKIMDPDPSDYVNTYVAAGVAIESNFYTPWTDTRGSLYYRSDLKMHYYNAGLGICNITDAQMNTVRGEKIKDYDGHGLGLPGLNQEQPVVAVRAMKRRILLVINNQDNKYKCKGCSASDIFIAAALAEGSNLFPDDIAFLRAKYRIEPRSPNGMIFDWLKYFKVNNSLSHNLSQIKKFYNDVNELHRKNADWAVPDDINWTEIENLSNGVQP
jgi:hypothetical protein